MEFALQDNRTDLIRAAAEIRVQRYPQSSVVLLAGSLVRGDGTASSDLDLVVVYDQVETAFRESFQHERWPVEAFVHDPETMDYFFRRIDRPSGIPSLAAMVSEGIEVPEANELSNRLKALAEKALAEGPPVWNEEDIDSSRYAITNLVEDLRAPRSTAEAAATLSALYPLLATHYFRSKALWDSNGKSIPRALLRQDPEVGTRFLRAFDTAFASGDMNGVVDISSEILEESGGFLFSGYRRAAPAAWRSDT